MARATSVYANHPWQRRTKPRPSRPRHQRPRDAPRKTLLVRLRTDKRISDAGCGSSAGESHVTPKYPPHADHQHRQTGRNLYRDEVQLFSAGDRVQLTAPSAELQLANHELGMGESIGEGRMMLRLDGGRFVAIDPARHPHLDHGYAVTSHAAQCQTADHVLIHVDIELGAKDLLNNRMAYVAISRGAHDAQIFTNDRERLGAALGRDISHNSAHAPELKPEHAIAPEQELTKERAPRHEHGMGLGR